MSIHIKNQHGAVINNVDGDQMVYGGQRGTVVTSEDARRAVNQLRGALAGAALDEPQRLRHAPGSPRSTQQRMRRKKTSTGLPARSNGSSSYLPTPDHWQRQVPR